MAGSGESGNRFRRNLSLPPNWDVIDRIFFALEQLGLNNYQYTAKEVPRMRYRRCKRIVDALLPLYTEAKLVEANPHIIKNLGTLLEPVMARLKEFEK